MHRITRLFVLALTCLFLQQFVATECLLAQGPVPYDIVYVRQPRYGDTTNTIWPEVFHPARGEPGADLMLLHPDGTEEVLVACSIPAGGNGICAVTDRRRTSELPASSRESPGHGTDSVHGSPH